MLSDTVISALIGAAVSIIVVLLNNAQIRKKDYAERAVRQQALDDELKTINKKLDVHNGYAEKFGDIQSEVADIKTMLAKRDTDIDWIKKYLDKE